MAVLTIGPGITILAGITTTQGPASVEYLVVAGDGGQGNKTPYYGGNGGSGIVIIRYQSSSQRGTGGIVTSSGGYDYYHTFTTSGTYTA